MGPEGMEQGLAYGLVIGFADADTRDGYLTHPAHLPLSAALQACAGRILVFDL